MAYDRQYIEQFYEAIRDERLTAANTATRIGQAFLMLLDYTASGFEALAGTIEGLDFDTYWEEHVDQVTGDRSVHLKSQYIGAWADGFLSAKGMSPLGGGSGVVLNDVLTGINNTTFASATPSAAGQTIVWNGTAWTFGSAGGGGGISMNDVWTALATADSSKQIDASHLSSALSGYLKLTGGTMTGDLRLGTSASSSDDSADLVYLYGNGNEKARIWMDDTYSSNNIKGPNFRLYDASGVQLVNTRLALLTDNIESATRLAGNAVCTLWGNTYWQNGQPQSVGVSGSNASLNYVNNITMNGSLKIGDAILSWDSNNNALKVSKIVSNQEVEVNLYATGAVSAKGMSSMGGGGASIIMDDVWDALATADGTANSKQIDATHLITALNDYATQTWVTGHFNNYTHPTNGANTTISAASGKVLSAIAVNNLGHVTSVSSKTLLAADIPGIPWSKITSGKPTTISGYGITDAVTDAGGSFASTDKIYDIASRRIFSGLDMVDAPVTGWISGLVLASNWNNVHYQHYLVEAGDRWYTTRKYENGSMKEWNTFAYLTDNVASATRLSDNTPKKLWGNTYWQNGKPQNVTGAIHLLNGTGNGIYQEDLSGTDRRILGMDASNPSILHVGIDMRGYGHTAIYGGTHGTTYDGIVFYCDSTEIASMYKDDYRRGLRIGNALFSWDSANNAIKMQKNSDGSTVNFCATGAVSALGMSATGFDVSDLIGDGTPFKVFQFLRRVGDGTSNLWHMVGTFTLAEESKVMVIEIYTGQGWDRNNNDDCNVKVLIKRSNGTSSNWTSASNGCARVSCLKFGDNTSSMQNIKVRIKATSYNSGQVWIQIPDDYPRGTYFVYGQYEDWAHNSSTNGDTTTAPTGNLQTVAYYDYTKTKTSEPS